MPEALFLDPNGATPVPLPAFTLQSGCTVRVWLARDRQGTLVHDLFQWYAHIVHGEWSHVPTISPRDHLHLRSFRGRQVHVMVEWAGVRVGDMGVVVARA